MILVYDGDKQAAEGVAQALRGAGHEVRILATFLGAATLARELKPEAVVFRADRNSVVTAGELLNTLAPLGIPLVLSGSPWCAYQVFASGWWERRANPVWSLAQPCSAEQVRAVVDRALRDKARGDPAQLERRRVSARLAIPAVEIVALIACALLEARGSCDWCLDVVLLYLASTFAGYTAWSALAAARAGFRVPVAWLGFVGAVVALQIFFVAAS